MCAARLMLARPMEGTVRERERVTHLVYLPKPESRLALVRACCGRAFGPGELELLDGVAGMPCEACLRGAPVSHDERKLPVADAISDRMTALEAAVGGLVEQVEWVRELLEQVVEPPGSSWTDAQTAGRGGIEHVP